MEENACYYCGITPAETIDHVVPQSLIEAARDSGDEAVIRAVTERRRRMTVPACRECNGLARAVYDRTLEDRRKRIAEKFQRRHRTRLDMPDWAAGELMELSEWMRNLVLSALVERDLLRARMDRLRRS